ncbi:trehalose synthase [Adhaeribacter aerolatus]|uniref:Maltokinase n=1 Tax=Adhaeribacter aerolatus TaxID=670289 RepID=A0A512B1S9_9BACT|nr:maltose alpha-D-glucosyltransferase [Adhaeribacter aerolatus]GEO05924.1 trehalose synthase [Adhaeribacter aerolatus]
MANDKMNTDGQLLWYKDAIIYELHIKAFHDSNGDGIGDFQGLMEKLDYLEDLGVTAIWLLPFYPSPLRDDGYDIADYYSINPTYGDINHFKRFMKEAHRRGLKVITELVLNHTSDQHPWFQRARLAKKGSPYRDFYVWTDDPNKYNEVRIIFKDYEASNWTYDPVAGQYYWHRFFYHQPDLNFDNPKVQEEVFKVLDFWLNMGVDGFRLDAVPYLFEREGTNCENLPQTHEFLKKVRAHVDKKFPGKMLLAEANMWPEDSAAYFGNGDECHMNYHFPIMPRMFMAVKMEDRYPITDIIDQTPAIPENCQWAMFLRNHDELTLEMVTDEERDYMYKVYTKDPLAKINLGIRHRLAPLLDNNRNKIELMNSLLFALPGTPVIYYGDEIGMGDNFYLGDRDGVRTPMQWSPDRNAGFSKANPHQLYLPVIIDPEYQYESVNVENQQKNSNSLLWWMKRIIAMRKQYQAFSRGEIKFLNSSNSKVLSFLRTYEDQTILVIANLSRYSEAAELPLEGYENFVPKELFSQNKFPAIKNEPYLFTVGTHGFYWFLLEKQQVDEETVADDAPLVLEVKNWEEMFSGRRHQVLLDKAFPNYFRKCRWFGGKARVIQKMEVVHHVPVPLINENAGFLIIRVNYNEGLPELYQLPVSFAEQNEEQDLRNTCPQSIIAAVSVGGRRGYLYDAVYSNTFRGALFELMAKRRKLKADSGELNLYVQENIKKAGDIVNSKVLSAEQSNTSIVFENAYFMKLYRKLDSVINPDLEITRFLTEVAHFEQVPKFIGAVELKQGNQPSMVLGMMQELVPNQGDAWAYFGESLKRYFERVVSQENLQNLPPTLGNLSEPATFDQIPEEYQNILGGAYVERVNLLGQRTGEMHLALNASPQTPDFEPEPFSLHYQRSMFSSFTSLVRGTFQSLDKNLKKLPESVRVEAQEIMGLKNDILNVLKEIFAEKITTMKIRMHGDYHLGQVLFTGKDFMIIDFEGEPARAFSERRLKRSPLRDVAGMIRSFHYAAYNALFQLQGVRKEDMAVLENWAEQWYHYVSGFYLDSYLNTVKGSEFIPADKKHLDILIQTYLLEKAIYELNYELNNRPDWVTIPIRGIKYIMRRHLDGEK